MDARKQGAGRWIAFRMLAMALPVLLVFAVELGVRGAGVVQGDPFLNVTPFQTFTREDTPDGEVARITHRYGYRKHERTFRVDKPESTFRVFLVGGSACAGWPHEAEETFGQYVEQVLQSMRPGREVEVINAAAHGFASYRVRHILDDLLEMKPDAVLVYCGNNEFLESRRYTEGIWEPLARRSHLVRWLRRKLTAPPPDLAGDELEGVAQFFWKKVTKQALETRSDPDQFAAVVDHYRHSMAHMVDAAHERGVPVLLCTVPVNLRDWRPTVSHQALTGEARDAWQGSFDAARGMLLREEFAAGIESMTKALEQEPDHAESHYWLGKLQEGAGRFAAATESYDRARDLDYNPFRALSSFNEAVRDIAGAHEDALLVDLDAAFRAAAVNGNPGFDLFLDYVHPNTAGNELIAREVLNAFFAPPQSALDLRIVKTGPPLSAPEGALTDYDDEGDTKVQARLFSLFAQNHQYAAAVANARHVFFLLAGRELAPGEDLPASFPENLREGFAAFRQHLDTTERRLRGEQVTADELEAARTALDAYYEKWHAYGDF